MPSAARPDPGGVFATDVHRRVLGHLPTPSDQAAYATADVASRLAPDPHTPSDPKEIEAVLRELKVEGLAATQRYEGDDVWYQTREGFEKLTGPIAEEPPPADELTTAQQAKRGPALISLRAVRSSAKPGAKVKSS